MSQDKWLTLFGEFRPTNYLTETIFNGATYRTGETDQNQLTLNSRGGRRQTGMESGNILSKQLYLSDGACFRVELWENVEI